MHPDTHKPGISCAYDSSEVVHCSDFLFPSYSHILENTPKFANTREGVALGGSNEAEFKGHIRADESIKEHKDEWGGSVAESSHSTCTREEHAMVAAHTHAKENCSLAHTLLTP